MMSSGEGMLSGEGSALFRFESPSLTVEFEGPQEFVSAQIEHLSARIRKAMDDAQGGDLEQAALADDDDAPPTAPSPAPTVAPPASPSSVAASDGPSLEEFYRTSHSREGRGALQEKILIFAYFLRTQRGKHEFSIDSLNACFGLVGATPPRSLANTLGIMKRTQRFFAAGSSRGHYALREKGIAYVRRLIGAH